MIEKSRSKGFPQEGKLIKDPKEALGKKQKGKLKWRWKQEAKGIQEAKEFFLEVYTIPSKRRDGKVFGRAYTIFKWEDGEVTKLKYDYGYFYPDDPKDAVFKCLRSIFGMWGIERIAETHKSLGGI